MLLGLDQLRSAEVDPRVTQIVSRTIGVDMHSHVQIPFVKNPADARPDPDIDLAGERKRSGFSAVCQTYNLDTAANAQTGEYYNEACLHGPLRPS
jgi:membrane dipeptidase